MRSKKTFNKTSAVKQLKKGNKKAFNVLFDQYPGKLFNYSLSLTHNNEAAEDIVQETFKNIWEKRGNIRSDGRFIKVSL